MRRAALASLAAATGLVIVKLAAAAASGSLALLSVAADSGLDAMVTGLTLFAVSVAARPPDADHPYGHGKAENVAAMVEAVALLLLSVGIAREAILRLTRPAPPVDAAWYTFAVMGLAILVDLTRSQGLARAGRRHNSPALLADAVHFRADLLTSVVVLAGLLAVRLGHPGADAAGGFLIAAYVGFSSVRLGKRSIDALMDRTPAGAVGRIRRAAETIEGVEEVRRVRVRYAGGQPQTDIVVGVSRTLPLEVAHTLTEEVEDAVRSVEPGADVIVHVEPLADETVVAEQVLSIAGRHPDVHQVHNVFVAHHDDGLHIALHAKFPSTMALAEAHALAEALEADIAGEVGALQRVARVDTHLEPLEDPAAPGVDVTAAQAELVASVTAVAEAQPQVRNCHEVVVTNSRDALSVLMHCEAAAGLPVSEVHDAATAIEGEVHRRWPAVERVTVHFEPLED
ncbi:MAG TPA: cation diffusion facilitator family transporter [Actinomycetota bacterium]|nr:cation diffusion facilitator family transporter [Actinomycetota bacterium]